MMKHRIATYHQHVQDVPAITWTIVHNLFDYPVIDVFMTVNGALVKIVPTTITHVDNKTATVTFSQARAGVAMVS